MTNQRIPLVLEIKAPRTAEFLKTLNPEFFGPLDYIKDLHGRFLVMDWPNDGEFRVMDRDELRANFSLVGWKRNPAWFFEVYFVDPK